MTVMRFASSLFLVLFASVILLAGPASLFAAQEPPLLPAKCPKGASTGDPSGTKVFLDSGSASATTVRDYMNRIVSCPSACYSERVTISRVQQDGKDGMSFKVVGTNICKDKQKPSQEQTPPLGCAQGQTQPQATVDIPEIGFSVLAMKTVLLAAQTIGPKSRCSGALTTTIDNVFDKLATRSPGTIATAQSDLDALRQTPDQAPAAASPAVANAGTEALAQSLQLKGFGVDASVADNLVKSDPAAANNLIAAFQTGDPVAIKTAAQAASVTLNPDTIANAAALSPAQRDAVVIDMSAQARAAAQNTGFGDPANEQPQTGQPAPQIQCGLDSMAGYFAKIESGCGVNTSSATTNVVGPYQFKCSTWSDNAVRTGNGQYADCSYANDSTISTQVMNDVVDKIYRPGFGNTINQLGIDEKPGLYMPHLLGENGATKFFAAYAQDPNMSADQLRSVLGNAAIDNNRSLFYLNGTPRTLDGVLTEVNYRMTGTTGPALLASNAQSPFGSMSGGYGSYSYPVSTGSPFANVSPVPIGYPTASGYPTGGFSQPAQTTSVSQTPTQTTAAQAVTVPTVAPKPVAVIIVQPAQAIHGNPLTISWSTVGMRADLPCQVLVQSTSTTNVLAQGNEGSQTITPASIGTLNFSLQCNSTTGVFVQQATSASIR